MILPAITDFIKGTLEESLKKLVQPAGVIPATIFLLLNLFLTFPTLDRYGVVPVTIFLSLSSVWQIALAMAVVLVLAYLLLSMTGTILKLMTGESWADSPVLGRLSKAWQKDRLKALDEDAPRERAQRLQAKWERTRRFPAEEEYVAPTALGNVLNASASYIWQRYGIDMTALWPHMETAIAGETALVTRIDNEKATLDFLLNLGFVLATFAVEYALVLLWASRWPTMPWALVFLALAYVVYRAAVSKARAWGQGVQMAFDLHRDKLREALGLRKFKSKADEREVWKDASGWLLWGHTVDDIFADEPTPPPPGPTVTASDNVQVKFEHRTLDLDTEQRRPQTGAEHTVSRYLQYIDYVLIVSNAAAEQATKGCPGVAENANILVADTRVLAIDDEPAFEALDCDGNSIEVSVLPTCEAGPEHNRLWHSNRLLWRITTLPSNKACALHYCLPIPVFLAITNHAELKIKETIVMQTIDKYIKYEFLITNEGDEQVSATLEVFDSRVTLSDKEVGLLDTTTGTLTKPEVLTKPARYRWLLGSIAKGEQVNLTYDTPMKKTGG